MLRTELVKAQELATEMLIDEYDYERGIPKSAISHTDLWPGDTNVWVDAYLTIERPDLAIQTFETALKSIRPDGSVPHLMQSSHIRGGVETRWVDRQYHRISGAGIMKLPNGEWVTKIYAPPTLALSALAIAKSGLELPDNIVDVVTTAQERLYEKRGNKEKLIIAKHRDELTNNSGGLADVLGEEGAVMDPAVNALMVQNGRAILQLAGHVAPNSNMDDIRSWTDETQTNLFKYMTESRGTYSPERTLAIARIEKTIALRGSNLTIALKGPHLTINLREPNLQEFYSEPSSDKKHPERTHLSMDKCIELAHSTPYLAQSIDYMGRIIPKLANGGFTRFENATPGSNPVENKGYRRQFWLPVAAQIVQIDKTQWPIT